MQINLQQAQVKYAPYIENGLCPTDPRVIDTINRAEEYLITQGKWRGLVQRMVFCVESGCITLPPNVEAVLELSGPCGEPISIKDSWFEFLPGGTFQLNNCNKWCSIAVDRGINHCTIYDVAVSQSSPGKLLRIYCDLPEATDAQILIQGNDENGNRVQTLVDGVYEDGELINLNNATPQTSVNQWSYVQAIQKPYTNGVVRMYQVDPANPSVNLGILGRYQPSETIPEYRRIYFNGICDSNGNTDPVYKRITILAKMQYVPLVLPSDILQITCSEAMRRMCEAFYHQGAENSTLGDYFENKAIAALQAELKSYLSGAQSVPKTKFSGFGNRAAAWQPH